MKSGIPDIGNISEAYRILQFCNFAILQLNRLLASWRRCGVNNNQKRSHAFFSQRACFPRMVELRIFIHIIARIKDRSSIPWGVTIHPLNPKVTFQVEVEVSFYSSPLIYLRKIYLDAKNVLAT